MICFDDDFDGILHDQSFNDQRNFHHQSFNDHRIFDRVTTPLGFQYLVNLVFEILLRGNITNLAVVFFHFSLKWGQIF